MQSQKIPALALIAVLLFHQAAWPQMASGQITAGGHTPPSVKANPPSEINGPAAFAFSAYPTPEEIFRARLFEEPLVPIGGKPDVAANAALATALQGYAKRTGPDDFSSLTTFLHSHPTSPWRAALLTNLGLEYYRTGHYSLTLPAWGEAWQIAKDTSDPAGKAIADRAAGELAAMYARLGRMPELASLLKSVQARVFVGPATEKIANARAGLSTMQTDPGIAFRCGPLALNRIKLAVDPEHPSDELIASTASTQQGFSLTQVAALSQKTGLNYQMAYREKSDAVVVPSVVHWKVGHYAAVIRQEGERYLVQDPTFRNDVWATRAALQAEASGYFLVPAGPLPAGWRTVAAKEGDTVWGKGNVGGPDPGGGGGHPKPDCKGMAVPDVDLLFVSLGLSDEPVGYTPPVGPPVSFLTQYNQRDSSQPANFSYSNFGSKWTFGWLSYITDDPTNPAADVQYYRMGGFIRFFTGFNATTQTFALQPLDLTKLVRTSTASYEMVSADGSKIVFSQSDGSTGSARKIFLKQIVDPQGNAVTLSYDGSLRVISVTDAIGQATTLSYANTADPYKITRVTDPFGRFATFDYDASNRLVKITDVIGLTSQFTYDGTSDFINSLITGYGTTTFTKAESGTTRSLETLYPDGYRERVEFNQSAGTGIPISDPAATVPSGMSAVNYYLYYRNTFFWSKIACATAYGDYTKAKVYHWNHTTDLNSASRIPESTKEPFENRVWYNYPGQSSADIVGTSDQPTKVGRVLDDGTTQLTSYEYNDFGQRTKMVDPAGRTFSYVYAPNGQDLLETRMTRGGANELLSKTTYTAGHQPETVTDASGQTATNTYNARGQLLTHTNAKNEVTTAGYSSLGYLTSIDGPLPGAIDQETYTYDAVGRTRTRTNSSGYTLTFDHDALDRITRITFPDGTSETYTFTLLDLTQVLDRAGRTTNFEFNGVRQMTKRTDPLGRATLYEWCKCGEIGSLTDPMGRTTVWHHDLQNRRTSKAYPDGSQEQYFYENTTSRLRRQIDLKNQETDYAYNPDDTLGGLSYPNAAVATPSVAFTYDPSYLRLASMTDGTGTTLYSYNAITGSPTLGAGSPSAVDGPLANDTITFSYDALGRRIGTAVNGVAATLGFDAGGRKNTETTPLGTVTYAYDGGTTRLTSKTFPNGLTTLYQYGTVQQDETLQSITNKVGATPLSAYGYTRDLPRGQISAWTQQADAQAAVTHTFTYDAADQLAADAVTTGTASTGSYAYAYDPAGNRQSEQIGTNPASTFSYNALNELTSQQSSPGQAAATYRWDAVNRLVEVDAGNQATQFTYDGLGRRVAIRRLVNGTETSLRRFVWCDQQICEERDATGAVTKRYYEEGVKIESGASAGSYFYTRDDLGSVCELVDAGGSMRARYRYDPSGRATRVSGDVQADFGFAGMFWSPEAALNLTYYRAYDPGVARWLSRDPLPDAEISQGPNLYTYVRNDPVLLTDPLGLEDTVSLTKKGCCDPQKKDLDDAEKALEDYDNQSIANGRKTTAATYLVTPYFGPVGVLLGTINSISVSLRDLKDRAVPEQAVHAALLAYNNCLSEGCGKKPCLRPGRAK